MFLIFTITVLLFMFLFRLSRICRVPYVVLQILPRPKCFKEEFWEKFPEKLPSEVSITNLMLNWDKLQLSWNNIDVLDCILPNKANEIAILNSRKFIQHPIEPWDSVHKDLVRCVFIFLCVCFYLFIEQWDSVHKDLVRCVVIFVCICIYLWSSGILFTRT